MEALNLTRVPTTSKWRQAGNVYYPPDIREVSAELPPPTALASVSSEQPLIIQASLPLAEVSKGLGQAGDQGQGFELNKDKGKGKEFKPLSKAKDPKAALSSRMPLLRPRMLLSRQRRPRPNPKRLILRLKMLLPLSQATKKTLLRSPRHSLGSLSFALLVFCLHVNFLDCGSFAVVPGVLFLYLMKRLQTLQYLLLIDRNHCFALY